MKKTTVLSSILLTAATSHGALVSITSYTFDGSQNLTGFTVASGTYTNLQPAVGATGASVGLSDGAARNSAPGDTVGTAGGGGDSFFNFWAQGASEVNGFAGALNLNLNAGPGNIGDSDTGTNGGFVEFQFGTSLTGLPGAGNDIFIFELTGQDAITVQAIDGSGNVLGDQSISIAMNDWGTGSLSYQFYIDNDANLRSSTPIAGVAFDVEDFFSGAPSPIQGIRWTGVDGLDPVAVGYTVPEPGSAMLISFALAGGCLRRRRNH